MRSSSVHFVAIPRHSSPQMLVSLPDFRRDSRPMVSSTPSKVLTIANKLPTNQSYPVPMNVSFSEYLLKDSVIPNSTQLSYSCPTSPSFRRLNSASPITSEPEWHISTPIENSQKSMTDKKSPLKQILVTGSDTSLETKCCSSTTNLSTIESDSIILGYRSVQNRSPSPKSDELKQRLLTALADMIPHRKRLSLRLLINYTIDDHNSECIVIDETLCRRLPENQISRKRKLFASDCHDVTDVIEYDSGYMPDLNGLNFVINRLDQCSQTAQTKVDGAEKRRCLESISSKTNERKRKPRETQILDLSFSHLHQNRSHSTESKGNEETISTDAVSKKMSELHSLIKTNESNQTYPSIDPISLANPMVSGVNVSNRTTANGLSFVDNPVLTLLPLLQHQTQQQSKNSSPISVTVSNSNRSIFFDHILPQFSQTTNLSSTNAVESLLLQEIQTLLQATNNLNEEKDNLTIEKLINPNELGFSPTSTTMQNSFINNFPLIHAPIINPTTTTNTLTAAPSVGLPFLNAFSSEQLMSLFQSTQVMNSACSSQLRGVVGKETHIINSTLFPSTLTGSNYPSATETINGLNQFERNSVKVPNLHENQTGIKSMGLSGLPIEQLPLGTSDHIKSIPSSMTSLLNHLTNQTTQASPSSLRSFSELLYPNSTVLHAGKTCTTMNDVPTINGNAIKPLQNYASLSTNNLHQSSLLISESDEKLTFSFPNSSRTSPIQARIPSISNVSEVRHSNSTGSSSRDPLHMKTILESDGDSSINQHLMFGRRVTQTRRFTCNQCRKDFASLAELNRHTLEAHNSFKCTICSAHFTQRSNLQRHSLKHVGFKPFTCNLCKKEYYRKDHLVRHIEVTHPNHDPKMNITVHLTSSECLDYLDRIQAGDRQGSSPHHTSDSDGNEVLTFSIENSTVVVKDDHQIEGTGVDLGVVNSSVSDEPNGSVSTSNGTGSTNDESESGIGEPEVTENGSVES